MRNEGMLLVSEIFGPTLQGEGPSAGRSATFVRLGLCNLACTWCDTPYSWDRDRFDLDKELSTMTVDEIVSEVAESAPRLVVITGGEPGVQEDGVVTLARELRAVGKVIELETNGTHALERLALECDLLVVSPKLENSGVPTRQRLRMPVLKQLASRENAVFKFVVTAVSQLSEVEELARICGIAPHSVWIMPEGTDDATIQQRMRMLAVDVADRGWSLSGRLQIQLWRGERGW